MMGSALKAVAKWSALEIDGLKDQFLYYFLPTEVVGSITTPYWVGTGCKVKAQLDFGFQVMLHWSVDSSICTDLNQDFAIQ
jgi:hypothetical protein